ncbi:MAG: hypothetical protein DRI65_14805, partial [Chloroflexota bacterium]
MFYIYPLILCLVPAATIYWGSAIPIHHAYLSWITIAFLVGILVFIINLFTKNKKKTGVIVAAISIGFFYFENFLHLISYISLTLGIIQEKTDIEYSIVLPVVFFIIWSILWIMITRIIIRSDSLTHKCDHYLSVVSIILLIFMVSGIGIKINVSNKFQKNVKSILINNPGMDSNKDIAQPSYDNDNQPDIYYLIFDAFAGSNILLEYYDTDILYFIEQLEKRGLYVATASKSNYSLTVDSLPSSLNINYWDDLAEDEIKHIGWIPINPLLQNNLVSNYLRKSGYELVTFTSGFWPTEDIMTDMKLSPWINLNEYQENLLSFTPVPRIFPSILYDNHRNRINFILNSLKDIKREEKPVFVFAHILTPHPPFIFDEEGNPVHPNRPYSYFDADGYRRLGGTTAEYQEMYSGQLNFVVDRILEIIDEILLESEHPPILIIQGDHGPGSMVNLAHLENNNLDERFSIMNAYYFPDKDYSSLYPSITPVNTFRVVFNQYFEGNLPL